MADNLTAPAGSASGANSPGAIVGNTDVPYGCANLGAGDSLATAELAAGDAGEAGSLNDFSVEVWVQFVSSAPTVSTAIVRGPQSTGAGSDSQWILWSGSAAGAQFIGMNNAGTLVFSTQGAAMVQGSWYHLVGVITGGNIRVYVNGVDAGAVAFTGPIRPLNPGAGAVMSVVYAGGTNMLVDELAVYRTGLSAARVSAHYTAGRSRGFPYQGSGERVGAVLDAYSSTAPRSLQTGVRSVVPRYTSGQSPLSETQLALEAEDVDAAFFTKADGTLTFLADGHRSSSPYNTSQVTIGDAGGAEIPYESLKVDYSESFLINEWSVTRSPFQNAVPVTQTVSDAASISKYFRRSQSLSDVPCPSDANCATIATELLAKYKDPMLRVTELTFDLSDPSVAEAVLRRELMDRITVKRTPPGGGSRIDQTLYIQKIEISASNDGEPWTVRWAVSPL